MSVNEYFEEVEQAARYALAKTNAITVCPHHSEVTIRVGDDDAERHAYALATTLLKKDGTMWQREDVMASIQQQLNEAADGECPACAHLRDS